MESKIESCLRICPITPVSKRGLTRHLNHRTIFMAVSLTIILTTAGLVYYLIQPPMLILEPWIKGNYAAGTPHSAIAIDGDVNFSDTALLEGWPGDGSPENPFIIDGLYIDYGGENGHCISIGNTRASFTVSNCILTGAVSYGFNVGAGICLYNVTNGQLVNNICFSNGAAIFLDEEAYYNIVANNTCNNNLGFGIVLCDSDSNTIASNTCNDNLGCGIFLHSSNYNIVANNTCNSNLGYGISLKSSSSNTVVNSTCLGNPEYDIYIRDSDSNTLANNIIGIPGIPKEFAIVVLLLIGFVGIIVLGAVLATRSASTSDVVRNKKIQPNNGWEEN